MANARDEFYHHLLQLFAIQFAKKRVNQTSRKRCEDRLRRKTLGRSSWHIFLDTLCLLSNPDRANATSIAVEQAGPNVVRYWMAANGKVCNQAKDHLDMVLGCLAKMIQHQQSRESTNDTIFTASVGLCKARVKNYSKNGRKHLEILRRHVSCPKQMDVLLIFAEVLREGKPLPQLCRDAYNLRSSHAAQFLLRQAEAEGSSWSYLRHNIGRLGSWYKGSLMVTENAYQFSEQLTGFSVALVPDQMHATLGHLPHARPLSQLLSRVPGSTLDISLPRFERLFGPQAVHEVEQKLSEYHAKGKKLKVHAEVTMADFVHSNNIALTMRERYIGCSKGSCICCHIYFCFHPSDFVQRPCHGNAHVLWTSPERLAVDITPRMVQRLRDEVSRAFLDGAAGHAFTLDSTTNISEQTFAA